MTKFEWDITSQMENRRYFDDLLNKSRYKRHVIETFKAEITCNPGIDIAPGLRARWRPRHAFRFPLLRDSKRVGKFAADADARREALDMYPRKRRKPTDAAKSPARFERNA
jgi:hypothetical protein